MGLINVRVFRPFPMEELAAALSRVKAVAVMDKARPLRRPAFCWRPGSALYDLPERPLAVNYVYGLGAET